MGATTLTVDQLASHTHEYKKPNVAGQPADFGNPTGPGPLVDPRDSNTVSTGGSQSHTHNFSGKSSNASNLPPYYTLAMIMRCA